MQFQVEVLAMSGKRIIQDGDRIVLTAAEHALYSAGIRRGHAEALRQMAGQMRDAAKHYKDQMRQANDVSGADAADAVLRGYCEFAKQLEGPAKAAWIDQQRLTSRFLKLRPKGFGSQTVASLARGALGALIRR